jgi:hypothetical protein
VIEIIDVVSEALRLRFSQVPPKHSRRTYRIRNIYVSDYS